MITNSDLDLIPLDALDALAVTENAAVPTPAAPPADGARRDEAIRDAM